MATWGVPTPGVVRIDHPQVIKQIDDLMRALHEATRHICAAETSIASLSVQESEGRAKLRMDLGDGLEYARLRAVEHMGSLQQQLEELGIQLADFRDGMVAYADDRHAHRYDDLWLTFWRQGWRWLLRVTRLEKCLSPKHRGPAA